MKAILVALAPLSAIAFAPSALVKDASTLFVSGGTEWSTEDDSSFSSSSSSSFDDLVEPAPPRKQIVMSPAIPFLECPPVLVDCEMAGNVGFDPMRFAKSKEDLEVMREAEIRHSRLAMLVRLAWRLWGNSPRLCLKDHSISHFF